MIDSWEYAEDTRGTGFHGSRGFARPPRQTDLMRLQHGATVLGISLEMYIAHREAGESWCSGHKAWHPVDRFPSRLRRGERRPAAYCLEVDAEKSRAAYQRKKAKRAAGGSHDRSA